jgi:hypothetical protein
MPSRTLTALILAATLVVLTVAPMSAQVASLASPTPSDVARPVTDGPQTSQESLLAYAECMRKNGVDMDDPVFDANGVFSGGLGKGAGSAIDLKSDRYQLASDTCVALLVSTTPELDPAQQAELVERQLAYAACMRAEGVEMPDPATVGGVDEAKLKIDKTDPAFIAADEACGEALGAPTGK